MQTQPQLPLLEINKGSTYCVDKGAPSSCSGIFKAALNTYGFTKTLKKQKIYAIQFRQKLGTPKFIKF